MASPSATQPVILTKVTSASFPLTDYNSRFCITANGAAASVIACSEDPVIKATQKFTFNGEKGAGSLKAGPGCLEEVTSGLSFIDCNEGKASQKFSLKYIGASISNSTVGDKTVSVQAPVYQISAASGKCMTFIYGEADAVTGVSLTDCIKILPEQRPERTQAMLPKVLSSVATPAKSEGMSTGAIVGIVLGSIVGFVLLIICIAALRRRNSKRQSRVGGYGSQNTASMYQANGNNRNTITSTRNGNNYDRNTWKTRSIEQEYRVMSVPNGINSTNAKQYEVIYSYESKLDDEITLNVGDTVMVYHSFPDEWASGLNTSTGTAGVFPMICLAASPVN